MKTATYHLLSGEIAEIEYDEEAPCISCGQPVVEASMGGTVACPWCDCGYYRDGSKWTARDAMDAEWRKIRAEQIASDQAMDRVSPIPSR